MECLPVKYLLDTHIWILANVAPEALSASHRKLLENLRPDDDLMLSAISLWEVCKLVEKGKITLFEDIESWVKSALDMPNLRVIPLNFHVFYKSTTLPQPFHRDPADQMIVATARIHDATIVTQDHLITNYSHVKTV